MGHSYNHGLVTSSKGLAIEFVKVTALTVANGSNCTVDDGDSGLIQKCVHTATGIYTFTLNKPYPPKMQWVFVNITGTSATTDLIHPRYIEGSYNSTAGTFIVHLTDDDDVTAGVAVNGSATNELHLILVFNRYKNL